MPALSDIFSRLRCGCHGDMLAEEIRCVSSLLEISPLVSYPRLFLHLGKIALLSREAFAGLSTKDLPTI